MSVESATQLGDLIHDLIAKHLGGDYLTSEDACDMAWNALAIELDRVDEALTEIEENSDED